MAAVIFFGAVSCAKEDISTSLAGGEVEVTFTADLGQLGTRVYGDGKQADYHVYLGVYNEGGELLENLTDRVNGEKISNGKASIRVVLLKDKHYKLVFWAQHKNQECYSMNWAERQLTVDYVNVPTFSQDDTRDAFFLVDDDFHAGHDETVFTLKRPFAQLRAAISKEDFDFVKDNKVTITHSEVVVEGVANVLDLSSSDAKVKGNKTVTFASAAIPNGDNEKITVNGTEFYQLSMNYLLVNEKTLVDVEYTFTDGQTNYVRPYYAVPVQRNYRTNILGQLISSPMDFTVIINPEFDGAHEVTPWDGKATKEVTPNADGVYEISEASELAWLAAAVNGTRTEGNTYAGKTFVLTQDIDLCGHNWTPIGFNGSFNGIFDGNGKTISNLVVLGYNSTVGLFGNTYNGEIKNVTIKDAKVSGRLNVGVVAGNPYTSKYTNITVKGHIEVNGMAYVGGVGGKNAYANWTDVTVNVDKDSYVHANSVENGTAYRTYVGGVVGFNGEGTHSFTNIKSNVKVEGSTCDVGGLFGIAHYGNKFENCVCEGDVKIFAAEEAEEAEEIGGIAGVWNNGGQDVIMNNVEFNGKIITNVDATVWYGGLVGKPYSATGNGKLVLNGVEFTANGADLNDINEQIAAGNFVFPFDLSGKAAESNSYGQTGLTQLNGGIIDGNGFTLKVNNAGGTWDCAINTTGGTIKNLTITNGFRGIFVNHNSTHAEKVILENVTVHGPVYTISCDQGTNNGLKATNSTFNGWTSYAATIGEVSFVNCSFGEGAGYAFCRPYAPTTFTNCNFATGYEIDARATVVFENCTLNGVALTAENLATLVVGNASNAGLAVNVDNSEAGQKTLKETLNKGGNVILTEDVNTTDTGSNGYGSTGINVNGGILNGNGHTLEVEGATGTWDSAVSITSGTIKNITIANGFRGIFFKNGTSKIILDNVIIDGPTYTISCDSAGKQGVEATDCTFNGWTSYAGTIGSAKFTNCSFGKGAGYALCRPYAATEFVNCDFAAGYVIDARAAVTFENCTLGGVALTADNLATLVTSNTANATVK